MYNFLRVSAITKINFLISSLKFLNFFVIYELFITSVGTYVKNLILDIFI